jgi:folate-binding protein YgfZ
LSVLTSLSFNQAHLQVRQLGGYATLSDWRLLQISGPDAAGYLQTQFTNDVVSLKPGNCQRNALTDRKARLQAEFWLYAETNQFTLLVAETQAEQVYEHLEQYHFVEKLDISFLSDYELIFLTGPASRRWLAAWQPELSAPLQDVQRLPHGGYLFRAALTGDLGFILAMNSEQVNSFYQWLESGPKSEGAVLITPELWQSLTLEAGIPIFGTDMNNLTLLPETGLERIAVSYDKGCYLGQEVIARIKTYGVIPRALIGLVFKQDSPLPSSGSEILISGIKVGQITRSGFAPSINQNVAIAYLNKQWRIPAEPLKWQSDGLTYEATVTPLPFLDLPNAQELAQAKLDLALINFAGPEEISALPLLEEAILLNPNLIDAYESLGVILSRQGRHQEAIAVIEKLLAISPDEPMAHTNLSRFHMLLGDKQKAEDHMAESTRLNMQRQLAQQANQQAQARQNEAQFAQRQEMMAMFKEVLESEDPDDLVANYGLGKSYLDQGASSEALPYLEKATEIEPLYSVAWLQLGKAYQALGQKEKAIATFKQGIVAATQKGDLMPLKEMEQHLQNLGL